ncbi:MAG: GEVED domain-containing protein [Prevotella sp.]
MKIFTPLLSLGMALCAFNFAQAQSYTEPTQTVPTLKHAASQALYSVNVSIDGNNVMSYTDTNGRYSYNWLQEQYSFTAQKGQEVTLDVRAGIWSWDIVIGFDWDRNGSFEDQQRAFAEVGSTASEANSSWAHSPYNDANYRRKKEKELGHRGVLQHTFKFKVPETAKEGATRFRILCDGDGYAGGIPPFNLNAKIGYAGSMHDFGVKIEKEEESPETGINNTTVIDSSNKPVEIYTLDGLRLNSSVDKLTKGIYIINGKKVVIR